MRDADVMLALKERGALSPMTLAGPAVAPVVQVGDLGVARAIAEPEGVVAIIEPGAADQTGLTKLAQMLATAPNKPTVVVVARNFNALQMKMMFRGMTVEHVKARGKKFVTGLPMPSEELQPVSVVPKARDRVKKAKIPAPRFVFVGRDDEMAQLGEMLQTGGPIVVSGPAGIGKTSLVEHAIAATELTRLPDLVFARGVGADALFGRLAEITKASGSNVLVDALKAGSKPMVLVEAAIEALKASPGTEGQVMVLDRLHAVAGREGDFFRKSRLELMLEALLSETYPLRLVFTSRVQPVFYREGRAANIRRLELEGLKGRFYFELFQGLNVPEFERSKFGPMAEKVHGNPMAVRTYAVAVSNNPDVIDNDKFMRMESPNDLRVVEKQIEKRVEKLSKRHRAQLAAIAHMILPLSVDELTALQINRKDRVELLSQGLLDMIGTAESKGYLVHDMVRRRLGRREVSDFRLFEEFAGTYMKRAADSEGVQKLAYNQEANRMLVGARKSQDLVKGDYPDHDAVVDSTIGLLRAKEPRLDIAATRIKPILEANPSNSDAHLVALEQLRRAKAKNDETLAALEAALTHAPVPEVFHEAVGFYLGRKARGKAIGVLEQGVAELPDQSRLRTRLASLMLRQGRRPEAIEHLRAAMELDPMLPDAYGLLGMARREEGTDKLDEAETLLREAVRLAPGDVVQTSRLTWLLLDIARGVSARTEAVRAEVRELLDDLLQRDKESWEAHLLYAVALREEGTDLDRSAWFLKKARQNAPKRRGMHQGRFEVEHALLDLAKGELDHSESRLRKLAKREPGNHRVFSALSLVLEARGQSVAAHAELTRAAERTSPHSLDRQSYEQRLAALREQVESAAKAMMAGSIVASQPVAEASSAEAAPETAPVEAAPAEAAPETASVEAAPAEAAPETTSVEAAPVEATDDAPVDAAPAGAAPVEATDDAPVDAAPAEAAPETAPVDASPAEAAPETASVEAAPAEAAPVEAVPAEATDDAPVDASPAEATDDAPAGDAD
jgi:tetratricopeptide (TPR) repeat protein